MPRPSNTEQRREEIVQALLKVMAEKGYAKATIQAIAKEAGVRPGLIHYHFKSKQEILVELVKWVRGRAQERYLKLSEKAKTPRDKIRAFIDSRLAKGEGAIPEAVAAWVVIGTEAIRQPEVKEQYSSVIEEQLIELRQLIADASSKKMSTKKSGELAGIVIAAIEGSFQLSVAAGSVMPKNYAAENLMGLLDGAV